MISAAWNFARPLELEADEQALRREHPQQPPDIEQSFSLRLDWIGLTLAELR
ncbi:hypothetical protein ACGF5C_07160 [Micromonospora sp. NPDC047620]|uniref:hypothetical protein n=1 Tax=Micromonospora sp. NPDC047620 TaxID=3364251 RepID=UPI00371DA2C1